MSPKLFITVLEYAFKELNWEQMGINIDGQHLTNLCVADDIVLLSNQPDRYLAHATETTGSML